MLLIVASPWLLRRWPLSTASVACIALFMALHTLGGRYAYSNVPYDDWARALAGTSLSDALGWSRNHYDRLVHFAFGALSAKIGSASCGDRVCQYWLMSVVAG